jgi:hypothetical protein
MRISRDTLRQFLLQLPATAAQYPTQVVIAVLTVVLMCYYLYTGMRRATQRPPAPSRQVNLAAVSPQDAEHALVTIYEKRFDELRTTLNARSKQYEADLGTLRQSVDQLTQQLRDERSRTPQQTQTPPPQAPAPPPAPVMSLRRLGAGRDKNRALPNTTAPKPMPAAHEASPMPFVHLPANSFVTSTLLHGVYAPSDQTNPLPVLLSVDEAFVGPNHRRVPLQGCLAMGKAVADLTAERATIQLARLSCVLPDNNVFEQDINGYVSGPDGNFGVPGVVIRRDAPKLALAATTGFLAGAAETLSRLRNAVIVTNRRGGTAAALQDSAPEHVAFGGLAGTANLMAQHYLQLARLVMPAVYVPQTLTVNLVMQQGVTIEGLPADAWSPTPRRYAAAR